MKVFIFNRGCVREKAITQKLRNDILELGHEKSFEIREADIIIYITCAGTGNTIIECLKDIEVIRHLKKDNSNILITGCLTKIPSFMSYYSNFDEIKLVKNVDFVIPILNIINDENKRNTLKTKLANRTRPFYGNETQIQFFLCSGCLNCCSFCKTNYLDEPLTSIPYEIALKYLQDKIKHGTKSIILSGDNLTLYGIDLYKRPRLHEFIHDLSMTPGLMYLTINEVTAQNMYPELLSELIQNNKVVSVEIQLESASNPILDLMNRKYSIEQYDDIVRPLKKAGKHIGTVLMSGFPTENYDDLDTTIKYLHDRGIMTDSICQYGDFKFIPSSKLEQLSKREKAKDTKYLVEAIKQINYDILKEQISQTGNAIVLGKEDNIVYLKNFYHGYSLRKEHQELEIGDVITTPAKRLVYEKGSKLLYEYKY